MEIIQNGKLVVLYFILKDEIGEIIEIIKDYLFVFYVYG